MNPTIKTIADELGISISTVSRALKDHPRIGIKTKEEVNKIAKKINYIPNPLALNLQQKKTKTIGVIVPTLAEDFFYKIIQGIDKVTSNKGYNYIIKYSENDIEKEKSILNSLANLRVDGIMISLASNTNEYSHFIELEKKGIPIVFFDRVPRNYPCLQVKNNFEKVTEEAVKYLHKKGYSKIALFNGPSNLLASDERLNGYLKAIDQLNLEISPKFIKNTNLNIQDTQQKINELLDQIHPDAIIIFNDLVYMHVIKTCQDKGHKNIAFVSLGGLLYTQYFNPKPLAYFDFNPFKTGESAAHMLIEHLNGQKSSEKIIIDSQLVEYKE